MIISAFTGLGLRESAKITGKLAFYYEQSQKKEDSIKKFMILIEIVKIGGFIGIVSIPVLVGTILLG